MTLGVLAMLYALSTAHWLIPLILLAGSAIRFDAICKQSRLLFISCIGRRRSGGAGIIGEECSLSGTQRPKCGCSASDSTSSRCGVG